MYYGIDDYYICSSKNVEEIEKQYDIFLKKGIDGKRWIKGELFVGKDIKKELYFVFDSTSIIDENTNEESLYKGIKVKQLKVSK